MNKKQLASDAKTIETRTGSDAWIEARNRFACEFLNLVESEIFAVFSPRIRCHILWEDLQQAGRLGLLKAASNVTVERHTNFPPFARKHIRKQIVNVWHQNNLAVPLPRHAGEMAGKMHRQRSRQGNLKPLQDAYEMFPNSNQSTVRAVWEIVYHKQYFIDAGISGNSTCTDRVKELQGPSAEDTALIDLRNKQLTTALTVLTAEERSMLEYRYGLTTGNTASVKATSIQFGLSEGKGSWVMKRAVKKVRDSSEGKKLYL